MARIIKASNGLKFSQNTELTKEEQDRLNNLYLNSTPQDAKKWAESNLMGTPANPKASAYRLLTVGTDKVDLDDDFYNSLGEGLRAKGLQGKEIDSIVDLIRSGGLDEFTIGGGARGYDLGDFNMKTGFAQATGIGSSKRRNARDMKYALKDFSDVVFDVVRKRKAAKEAPATATTATTATDDATMQAKINEAVLAKLAELGINLDGTSVSSDTSESGSGSGSESGLVEPEDPPIPPVDPTLPEQKFAKTLGDMYAGIEGYKDDWDLVKRSQYLEQALQGEAGNVLGHTYDSSKYRYDSEMTAEKFKELQDLYKTLYGKDETDGKYYRIRNGKLVDKDELVKALTETDGVVPEDIKKLLEYYNYNDFFKAPDDPVDPEDPEDSEEEDLPVIGEKAKKWNAAMLSDGKTPNYEARRKMLEEHLNMYKGVYPFYPWFTKSIDDENDIATLEDVLNLKGENIWNQSDKFYDDWGNGAVYLKHGEGEWGTHDRYSGEHIVNPVVAMYEGIDSFNNGTKSTKSLKGFLERVKYLKSASLYDATGAKTYDTLNYKDWPILKVYKDFLDKVTKIKGAEIFDATDCFTDTDPTLLIIYPGENNSTKHICFGITTDGEAYKVDKDIARKFSNNAGKLNKRFNKFNKMVREYTEGATQKVDKKQKGGTLNFAKVRKFYEGGDMVSSQSAENAERYNQTAPTSLIDWWNGDDNLKSYDKLMLASLLADITSLGLSFASNGAVTAGAATALPSGGSSFLAALPAAGAATLGSIGTGMTATVLNTIADHQMGVSGWDNAKSTAMGLTADLAQALPFLNSTAKFAKLAKYQKWLKYSGAALFGSIGASGLYNQIMQLIEDPSSFSMRDLQHVFHSAQALNTSVNLVGSSKTTKPGTRTTKVNGEEKPITNITEGQRTVDKVLAAKKSDATDAVKQEAIDAMKNQFGIDVTADNLKDVTFNLSKRHWYNPYSWFGKKGKLKTTVNGATQTIEDGTGWAYNLYHKRANISPYKSEAEAAAVRDVLENGGTKTLTSPPPEGSAPGTAPTVTGKVSKVDNLPAASDINPGDIYVRNGTAWRGAENSGVNKWIHGPVGFRRMGDPYSGEKGGKAAGISLTYGPMFGLGYDYFREGDYGEHTGNRAPLNKKGGKIRKAYEGMKFPGFKPTEFKLPEFKPLDTTLKLDLGITPTSPTSTLGLNKDPKLSDYNTNSFNLKNAKDYDAGGMVGKFAQTLQANQAATDATKQLRRTVLSDDEITAAMAKRQSTNGATRPESNTNWDKAKLYASRAARLGTTLANNAIQKAMVNKAKAPTGYVSPTYQTMQHKGAGSIMSQINDINALVNSAIPQTSDAALNTAQRLATQSNAQTALSKLYSGLSTMNNEIDAQNNTLKNTETKERIAAMNQNIQAKNTFDTWKRTNNMAAARSNADAISNFLLESEKEMLQNKTRQDNIQDKLAVYEAADKKQEALDAYDKEFRNKATVAGKTFLEYIYSLGSDEYAAYIKGRTQAERQAEAAYLKGRAAYMKKGGSLTFEQKQQLAYEKAKQKVLDKQAAEQNKAARTDYIEFNKMTRERIKNYQKSMELLSKSLK